jgi:FeS assembly protein IscX
LRHADVDATGSVSRMPVSNGSLPAYRLLAMWLLEKYVQVDPLSINFSDLRHRVPELEGIGGDPENCGEKKLKAIQVAWIEKAE